MHSNPARSGAKRGRRPSSPRPAGVPTWSRQAGEWGAFVFAAFALLGTSPASVGLAVLTLAFLWNFRDWRILIQDPLIQACLAFAGYVAVHSLVTYATASEDGPIEAIVDAGPDWIKLLLFIPFGYWAGGRSQPVGWILFLALLGFTVGFLHNVDWASFDATFFYTRFEVYLPAVAFGMFSGVAVLGLIALRESFWVSGTSRIPGWARIAVWLLLLAIMLEALFLSFSRTTWIAFAIAAALLMYLEWRARRHDRGQRQQTATIPRLASALVVAIALALLLFTQWDRITERMLFEQQTAARLLRGEWSEVESNSMGLRVHALRFTAHLLSERPWFGWGAGASHHLIAQSEWPELSMDARIRLGHLHNAYAEILVQFGVVGLALTSAIVALLVFGTVSECLNGNVHRPFCRFLLVTLVFILIWNLTSYRIVRRDGLFFWIIFAGIAYSFRLRALIADARERSISEKAGSPA